MTEQISANASPLAVKSRYGWADYAKGLSICLVVLHHAFMTLGQPSQSLGFEIYNFIRFVRMPLFFFISGIFVHKVLVSNTKTADRVALLVYLYLVWVTMRILHGAATDVLAHKPVEVDLLAEYLVHPIRGTWFLFTLATFTAVMWLFRSIPPVLPVLLAAILSLTVGGTGVDVEVGTGLVLIDRALGLFVFFSLGNAVASEALRFGGEAKVSWLASAGLVFAAFAAASKLEGVQSLGGTNLSVQLAGIAFLVLLCGLVAKTGRLTFLKTLGRSSLPIYVLHFYFLWVLQNLPRLTPSAAANGVIATIAIVPACIFTHHVCQKLGLGFLFALPARLKPSAWRTGEIGRRKVAVGASQ